jgi:hypothetical protein
VRLTLPLILPDWTGHVSLCDASLQKLEEVLWLTDTSQREPKLQELLRIIPFRYAGIRSIPPPAMAEVLTNLRLDRQPVFIYVFL